MYLEINIVDIILVENVTFAFSVLNFDVYVQNATPLVPFTFTILYQNPKYFISVLDSLNVKIMHREPENYSN